VDSGEINSADIHVLVKRRRGDVKKMNQWIMGGKQI
jgi:hypothetical protein